MSAHPSLWGSLTLFPAGSGGRSRPVLSGYRPLAQIPGELLFPGGDEEEDTLADCAITLPGIDELAPGGTSDVLVEPLSPEYWTNLKPGDEIILFEGPTPVGTLRIEVGMDRHAFEEWRQAEYERAHPPDLDERVEHIRRALVDYIANPRARDVR